MVHPDSYKSSNSVGASASEQPDRTCGSDHTAAYERANRVSGASTMKVIVYTICKNEQRNLEAWLENVAEADEIVLVDTGSTDNTLIGARYAADKLGGKLKLHQITVQPWRFDDARNAALALVPADADICISLDLDERLSPGWRKELEVAWVPGTTRALYPYTWRHNPDETFYNNRIHARFGYRYRYPTHEGLYLAFDMVERSVTINNLHMDQFQDCTKQRPNDLFLLAWGEYEHPDSSRMFYYYGRELMWAKYYKIAIEKFEHYLAITSEDFFPEERSKVIEYLQFCKDKLNWQQ